MFNSLVYMDHWLEFESLDSSSSPANHNLSHHIDSENAFANSACWFQQPQQSKMLACSLHKLEHSLHNRTFFACLEFEWSTYMKGWLGILIFNQDYLCSACISIAHNGYLQSPCFCMLSVWDRIRRHNILRDILYDLCAVAAIMGSPHFVITFWKACRYICPKFLSGEWFCFRCCSDLPTSTQTSSWSRGCSNGRINLYVMIMLNRWN